MLLETCTLQIKINKNNSNWEISFHEDKLFPGIPPKAACSGQ